jgi:hypothetical protein
MFQNTVQYQILSTSFTLTPTSGKHLSLNPPFSFIFLTRYDDDNKKRKLPGHTFHKLLAAVGGVTTHD